MLKGNRILIPDNHHDAVRLSSTINSHAMHKLIQSQLSIGVSRKMFTGTFCGDNRCQSLPLPSNRSFQVGGGGCLTWK